MRNEKVDINTIVKTEWTSETKSGSRLSKTVHKRPDPLFLYFQLLRLNMLLFLFSIAHKNSKWAKQILRYLNNIRVVKLIADIFHPTTRISEDSNTATCFANTSSQQCEYRWYGTHVPTNGTFYRESSNQTLQLDESLNHLRCETKCRIRGEECIVTSSDFSLSTLESKYLPLMNYLHRKW